MAMDDAGVGFAYNGFKPAQSVGNFYGDGREWFKQAQPNNGDGAYVMWTDHGKTNRNYDASGNFLNEYKGDEAFGAKDLLAGAATVGLGMGLGTLLTPAAGVGAGAGGSLSKAALDGTASFGANSAPGALSLGEAAAPVAAAGGAGGGFMSNPIISKVLGGVGTSAVLGALGGNGSSGGSGLGGLGGIVSGIYDKYQQDKAANSLLDYMNTQQKKIDDVYDPNGERAKYLLQEMERKDAAAGRNSQYGPRTVDFLGKFGGEYANATANMARGLAGNYAGAYNQKASSGAGLSAGIGNFLQGSNISLQDIINSINSSPVSNASSFIGEDVPSGIPEWDAAYQNAGGLDGIDYGEYL